MYSLRFNHVFIFLMLASGLSSLVLPAELADRVRGKIDNLFMPVAQPVRAMAGALSAHFSSPAISRDEQDRSRSPADIEAENAQLRVQIAVQNKFIDDLQRQLQSQEALGDIAKSCKPASVWGSDAGTRQTLSIASSSLEGLGSSMPVIYPRGLVGKIEVAAFGGARVRVITDMNFTVAAEFAHFVPSGGDSRMTVIRRVATQPFTCIGDGHGRMIVANLDYSQVKNAGLQVGDWVTLADRDGWPAFLQGQKLGQVESIGPQQHQPLFADIIVKPDVDLMQLREVMVVIKK